MFIVFKYRFDGFRPLSMCSRLYISVFEIIGIPTSFLFSKIPYRFRFRWKNMKVKMVECFADVSDRFHPTLWPCRSFLGPFSSAAGSLVRSDLSFRSLCYLCLPLPMSSLGRIHVFPRYLLEHFPVRSMFSASDSFRKFGRSSDQFLCSSILFCCSMRSADGCPVLVGTFEFLFRKHNR